MDKNLEIALLVAAALLFGFAFAFVDELINAIKGIMGGGH